MGEHDGEEVELLTVIMVGGWWCLVDLVFLFNQESNIHTVCHLHGNIYNCYLFKSGVFENIALTRFGFEVRVLCAVVKDPGILVQRYEPSISDGWRIDDDHIYGTLGYVNCRG